MYGYRKLTVFSAGLVISACFAAGAIANEELAESPKVVVTAGFSCFSVAAAAADLTYYAVNPDLRSGLSKLIAQFPRRVSSFQISLTPDRRRVRLHDEEQELVTFAAPMGIDDAPATASSPSHIQTPAPAFMRPAKRAPNGAVSPDASASNKGLTVDEKIALKQAMYIRPQFPCVKIQS